MVELIKCEKVSLTVPIYSPSEQKLTSNPIRIITEFYKPQMSRSSKTLLNNITFKLYKSEAMGVLGHNGAGKTTLMRVLGGIYKHTAGNLEINGKVSGLFNIRLGMDLTATGLENVYLRGMQMGMSMARIKEILPEILEFAEIGDSINEPLSAYSNGMRLRLAVAVSTMIEPDILVMDEWIGTGDIVFRKKINARMEKMIDQSKGLVMASHNTHLLKNLCNRGIVLDQGVIKFAGKIEDALNYYNEELEAPPKPST